MIRTEAARSTRSREDRATRAYTQLRELIVRGKLAPGTWVIETDLAARLGVSRTPIRAALQRLAQEGYIVENARGLQYRATVAALTNTDAAELFAIVGQLEALAARKAAGLPEAERAKVSDKLDAINERLFAACASRPDHSALFDLDTSFHDVYVQAGAGPRLRALHAAVKPQAERYIRLYYSALVDQIGISTGEHQIILEAIRAGEGEAAQRAVELNWRNAAERLVRIIQSVGERGSW